MIAELINVNERAVSGLIIGEGELLDELKKYATEKGLSVSDINEGRNTDIIFTGAIQDINAIIHDIDIITLTSNNEGTPVTLLEGQSAGKPVLSTEVGGIRDITSEKSTMLSPAKELTPLH